MSNMNIEVPNADRNNATTGKNFEILVGTP